MLNRRKALEDVDYVIRVVRIGGLEACKLDIEIPLSCTVDQCAGGTLCPRGIMHGQRNIAGGSGFLEGIRQVANGRGICL